jgi:hypothetical protein
LRKVADKLQEAAKDSRMKLITALLGVIFALTCFSTVDAEIFSWTDENGVKHYSNAPPTDVDDIEVEFKEYQTEPGAAHDSSESEEEGMEELLKDIERDQRRERAALEKSKNAQDQKPTKEQRIANEKKRLIEKIAELEEKPLDYFGSQRNKISRIGYYKYKLEELNENPEKYFSEPTKFEGNVKEPED